MELILRKLTDPGFLVEVAVLWAAVYAILRFLRSTRGFGMLRGLASAVAVIFVAYQLLQGAANVPVLSKIFSEIAPYMVLIVIILFQPEMRQGLARVGRSGFLRFFMRNDEQQNESVHEVVGAARRMAQERVGALIAFERGVSLAPYRDSALNLDSPISGILLETIFFHGSPLHDGAVILQEGKIAAASALFPLTNNPEVQRRMGTRHRAALGLTEETDAITLVVSEETGRVSLCSAGRIFEAVPLKELEERLLALLSEDQNPLPQASRDEQEVATTTSTSTAEANS